MAETTKYIEVSLESLQEGMLTDRPLYIYLAANEKYVRLVQPLHILEASKLDKIKKKGVAFSTELSVQEKYSRLKDSAKFVREFCDNADIAEFEKNRTIHSITEWILPYFYSKEDPGSLLCPLFLIQWAFGVPRPETLLFLSDISVDVYEKSLRLSALSGCIALWLGYSQTQFLSEFVQAVFCREIMSSTDIKDIPGLSQLDTRFIRFVEQGPRGILSDELHGILECAHLLIEEQTGVREKLKHTRVFRKLTHQFKALEQLAA